ncbi:MAG TPA: cytochrome c oxidase subunit II [Candidatus Dormibacteraeota bacterium]|nr:cytochrome c oxidase subunit II [Candidatus Dormibacteraeota bacterium]
MRSPNRTHAPRLLVAWAVLSVIGIVAVMQIQFPPGDQSRQAADQSSLLSLMAVLSTPVFVGVVLFLIYAALAFRRGKVLEDGPPSYGNIRVQVAWIAITAVVVFFLAGIGITQLASASSSTDFSGTQLGTSSPVGGAGQALQVQVIGQQWYFTYRYPDFGGVESLHLVLPVDANVEIHVTSTDILHSFWAYQLGVKADANPGVDNIAYVTTTHTGSFTVRCAELCGIWHGNMSDTSGKVVSQSDFATWVAQLQKDEKDTPVPPYAPAYFPSPRVKGS